MSEVQNKLQELLAKTKETETTLQERGQFYLNIGAKDIVWACIAIYLMGMVSMAIVAGIEDSERSEHDDLGVGDIILQIFMLLLLVPVMSVVAVAAMVLVVIQLRELTGLGTLHDNPRYSLADFLTLGYVRKNLSPENADNLLELIKLFQDFLTAIETDENSLQVADAAVPAQDDIEQGRENQNDKLQSLFAKMGEVRDIHVSPRLTVSDALLTIKNTQNAINTIQTEIKDHPTSCHSFFVFKRHVFVGENKVSLEDTGVRNQR